MNFSQRTNWHRRLNRLSEAAEERRRNGQPVHDLTTSNPTECGFTYPEEEILQAISNRTSLTYTPDPRGLLSAREAVSELYADAGVTINPSHIIITSGSSEAYSHIFRVLCNPGDSVLTPAPSYPLFEYLAQLHDVRTASYELSYDLGWQINIDSIRDSLLSSTRAIIIINPHNPTGMFLKRHEWNAIVTLAAEHRISIIVDEVFSGYGISTSAELVSTTAGTTGCLIFTLNGISKLCGLPQMKLGWIAVSGGAADSEEALERLEIVNDTYLSANTPVQAGIRKLFDVGKDVRIQILERCAENRKFLETRLQQGSSCSILASEGGWNAVLRVPATKSEEEWSLELLDREGVLVYPGYYFDFTNQGYLVVSLLVKPALFRRSTEALIRCIDRLITL